MVDTTLSPPAQLSPPFAHPPQDDTTAPFSQPWVGHFTDTSNQLASLTTQLAAAQAAIAAMKTGVTDGSDAAPGEIGEFLSASSSGLIPTATPIDVTSLVLHPGDWDVSGSAYFQPDTVPMSFTQIWLGTAPGTPADPGRMAFLGATANMDFTCLIAGPRRFNITAPATLEVRLGVQANFASGTVNCLAFIRARRVR